MTEEKYPKINDVTPPNNNIGETEEDFLSNAKIKNKKAKLWGETITTYIGYMLVWLIMIIVTTVLLFAIVVWAGHNIYTWDFLIPEQVEKIQTVLFSGSVAALVSNAIRTFSGRYFVQVKES